MDTSYREVDVQFMSIPTRQERANLGDSFNGSLVNVAQAGAYRNEFD
jgi:hypothetical protein